MTNPTNPFPGPYVTPAVFEIPGTANPNASATSTISFPSTASATTGAPPPTNASAWTPSAVRKTVLLIGLLAICGYLLVTGQAPLIGGLAGVLGLLQTMAD